MRIRAATALVLAGLIVPGVRAEEPVPPAPARGNSVEAMKAPLKDLAAFLSNASFKLKKGVGGVGSPSGGGFSIQGCCAINMEKMRGALDVLARERSDLQREYERGRHSEGLAKLDELSLGLKTFEEGYRLLGTANRPDLAQAVLDGLIKSLHAIEAAQAELSRCCVPAER